MNVFLSTEKIDFTKCGDFQSFLDSRYNKNNYVSHENICQSKCKDNHKCNQVMNQEVNQVSTQSNTSSTVTERNEFVP